MGMLSMTPIREIERSQQLRLLRSMGPRGKFLAQQAVDFEKNPGKAAPVYLQNRHASPTEKKIQCPKCWHYNCDCDVCPKCWHKNCDCDN